MESLHELYSLKLRKVGFLPRKKMPNGNRVILCGVPKSGKTFHLLNELNSNPNGSLYIDMQDPRLDLIAINKNLKNFCVENSVKFLAIDNYNNQLDLDIDIEKIWVAASYQSDLAGYKRLDLYGLDFEEFIAFDRSNDDPQTLFNRFLKNGSLIELVNIDGFFRGQKTLQMLRLLFRDNIELEIYCYLLEKNGFILTPNQIYTALKNRIKISKDRLYKFYAHLENSRLIFTVGKLDLPNAPKKIYAFDHAIRSATTMSKNLLKSFESMVALELIKKGEEIYYDDYIDLIIPSKGVALIAQPFATMDSIFMRTNAIRSNDVIKKIEFITMGFEYQKEEDGVIIEAVPFWVWALR